MDRNSRIYIAGHRGLAGSAIHRRLERGGYTNLITRTHAELDLAEQEAVRAFFAEQRPEYVFLAAAKVGGILANASHPAEFIGQNLAIQTNVIHEAWRAGAKRLLFLGSSCVYPRECPQPMAEGHLLTGPLEVTNRPYAVAKIAGIEMCWSYNRQYATRFLSVMPSNLYGPGDNFDLEESHVLPALVRKFHLAKLARRGDWEAIAADEDRWGPLPADVREALAVPAGADAGSDASSGAAGASRPPRVVLWGSGAPRREFLHADDMADACAFLMSLGDERFDALCRGGRAAANGDGEPAPDCPDYSTAPLVNIGAGEDLRIHRLAELVRDVVGYEGEVSWDRSRPDGTPRKLLDVSRLQRMGWEARTPLAEGIRSVYEWYLGQSAGA